ncbi:ketopantoate reductase family protein [Robertkochia aurantiaca]|uniref:ketopantoate reductase family protein n=1 Tax=Robertkochia aurantiaca TaxID=2873700 RepID=UPI001CCE1EBE|nr:2-dehydropantoate 2-reductase [Robertkochia sp. 3YJGBD-33]
MQILVYGIGGVGGYFGGRLTLTDSRVTFLARGDHAEAIKRDGLKVRSIYGDFLAVPDLVTDRVDEAGNPDLVLLCTKTWQVEEAAAELAAILKPDSVVIPLQNGVNNAEKLARILGEERVMGGLCRIISKIDNPGVINHFAFHPQIIFGELFDKNSQRGIHIKSLFDKAGFDSRLSEDIELEIWRKFLFICTLSGMGALTRSEVGVMREDPEIRSLMKETAREIIRVANARKVFLGDEDLNKTFEAIDKQDYHTTASVQRDIMAGRPSEIDDFNGYIVREAERLKVKAPVNRFIYNCLMPQERAARKRLIDKNESTKGTE